MKNDKLSAKSEIKKLVNYLEQDIHQPKALSFNEALTRLTPHAFHQQTSR